MSNARTYIHTQRERERERESKQASSPIIYSNAYLPTYLPTYPPYSSLLWSTLPNLVVCLDRSLENENHDEKSGLS